MIPFAASQNTPSTLFTGVQARPAGGSFPDASAASSSTITSNDFLTLLVTEMKNQDPTNATDPNQYINQLVSVNSLEQLIEINQTLGSALYSGTGATSGSDAPPTSRDSSALHAAGTPLVTSGNLSLPPANPAAQQIARALSPHPRA
jgi:flagellar basal-body rod modification protein FlgD